MFNSRSCGHVNAGYPVFICGDSDPENEPDGCGAEYDACNDCIKCGSAYSAAAAEFESNHECEFRFRSGDKARIELLEKLLVVNGITVPE